MSSDDWGTLSVLSWVIGLLIPCIDHVIDGSISYCSLALCIAFILISAFFMMKENESDFSARK